MCLTSARGASVHFRRYSDAGVDKQRFRHLEAPYYHIICPTFSHCTRAMMRKIFIIIFLFHIFAPSEKASFFCNYSEMNGFCNGSQSRFITLIAVSRNCDISRLFDLQIGKVLRKYSRIFLFIKRIFLMFNFWDQVKRAITQSWFVTK